MRAVLKLVAGGVGLAALASAAPAAAQYYPGYSYGGGANVISQVINQVLGASNGYYAYNGNPGYTGYSSYGGYPGYSGYSYPSYGYYGYGYPSYGYNGYGNPGYGYGYNGYNGRSDRDDGDDYDDQGDRD